ncbi:hypothetical protein J008_04410 [Cryptococcus neoformans]|nr:hypothetical protein C362_03941 [Cryptococcus neoformans var. grubii Bt1]OWZ65445.1 hypothetical protein AYX15_03045 [Cryptococcus neoformans var. grubii]OXC67405.1 hypothetical protein AYX13_04126 [Cryptococcus neoformans var. grubii]OXH28422.1 hypothetical protein J008_04410 [Cryptococcus neoformans var. grubii]
MSAPQAGPSQPIAVAPQQQSQQSQQSQAPQAQQDLKRRAEVDADAARRLKHPRPPLPPPHVLSALISNSPAFNELMKIEQKLDWTLMRKKAEVNDALGRPTRVKRVLRVFISNTAHDQDWQKALDASAGSAVGGDYSTGPRENPGQDAIIADGGVMKNNEPDLNTGKGIAGWILKVEGRLLDSGNVRLDKTKRKFTTFLKSAIIEFDNRDAPTFPEGNIVEWHATSHQGPPLDGFEILRRGDANIPCRISLHIAHYPERYKVLEPLAGLVGLRESTRSEVMSALWKLVKTTGAQDKEDGTVIKAVGGLQKLLPQGQETVPFHELPEIATRYLAHPDPVVIPYTIDVSKDYTFHNKCFDIPIEIEDPLKSKMASMIGSFEGPEGQEIVKLEDKVAELAFFAKELKQKKDFLESFAANPQAFINNWLAAQARDLDQMLGYQIGQAVVNGGSVREEDLRRSDLFTMPWVDEAITVHESARMEHERRAQAASHGNMR